MVCIMRCKKYEPDNVKQLVQEIILKQNPKFKNIFENEIKTWPLYFTPKNYFNQAFVGNVTPLINNNQKLAIGL